MINFPTIPMVAMSQGHSVAPPEVTAPARTVTAPKAASTGNDASTGDRPPDAAEILAMAHKNARNTRAREALLERMSQLPQAMHASPAVVITAKTIQTPYADILNMLRVPPYSLVDRQS